MDIISKYYKVCELFGDNLNSVAIAIRISGSEHKPSLIVRDLEELWIDKYLEQIDFLHDIGSNSTASFILQNHINEVRRLSRKYHFNPSHELKIGSIVEGYSRPERIKSSHIDDDKCRIQKHFEFGE